MKFLHSIKHDYQIEINFRIVSRILLWIVRYITDKNDIFMRKKNDLAKLKADEHQNNSRFKSQINRQNKSS